MPQLQGAVPSIALVFASLSAARAATSTQTLTMSDSAEDLRSHPSSIAGLTQKYTQEKEKRLRADGQAQYEELAKSTRLASLAKDPFADHEALNQQPPPLRNGQEVQVVILGAGFGGLLFAARLIEAGINPDGIRIVDAAGGFGGTWYWVRWDTFFCHLLHQDTTDFKLPQRIDIPVSCVTQKQRYTALCSKRLAIFRSTSMPTARSSGSIPSGSPATTALQTKEFSAQV